MGRCTYCGESAGWFKTAHDTCEKANLAAKSAMVQTICKWIPEHPDVTDFGPLLEQLNQIAAKGHVNEEMGRAQSREGIYAALDVYLEDGVLSKLEEDHLFAACDALGVDTEYLWKHPHTGRFVGAGLIRRVLEDEPWDNPWNPSELGLILSLGEQLLWVQRNLHLSEPKTSRTYVGASSGVSIRVARGVYYRLGQFKGHPIDRTEVVEVAQGTLALTNQQLYFLSPTKGFKIAYRKLVSITPLEDGVGLQRDGISAKPQFLRGGDGWLLYNLIMNFAERDREQSGKRR